MRNLTVPICRFLRARNGGVAIVFSLSLLALAMVAGLAMDYARGTSTVASLQQDVDATLLFVGRQRMAQGPEFDAQAAASNYLSKMRRQNHASGEVTITISEPLTGLFKGVAHANVRTTFARLFGVTSTPITVQSEVAVGDQPVEVALVLDNTYSMNGSKLDGLKSASKALIDIAYQPERALQNVRIGIVPFAQYVNVGMANRNQSWINVQNDYTITDPQICYDETPVTSTSNCHMETRTSMNDGTAVSYETQVCDYTYGPPVHVCYTPTWPQVWYGCVGSRDYPLETLDEQYDKPIPGIMNVTCQSEISPLGNDINALKTQIDAMVANGETYLPSGLIWGWRLLSKQAPYEEAAGYDEPVNGQIVRKVLVLMTDGKNTLSPTYPTHVGTDTAKSDQITAELCSNIKAKGIEIYTVAFQVPDAESKTVLESCASSASKYFDAVSTAELETAFRRIGMDFNPMRITR